MNLKKAKAVRRRMRQLEGEGATFAPRALVEVPHTKRVKGWKYPDGWKPELFRRLMTVGGPWRDEAMPLVTAITTVTMTNAMGSARRFYQEAKRRLA
jgi:hypothetical protein